jgi:hypothetical protein
MLMDNWEGGILGISNVFSLNSNDEPPKHIRKYTKKHYPEFLHTPTEWTEPNMTTWKKLAEDKGTSTCQRIMPDNTPYFYLQ